MPLCAIAQRSELGIGGGIMLTTAPGGTMYYKATESNTTPVLNLSYLANMTVRTESRLTTQLGFNIHVMSFAHESADTFNYFNVSIGNDGKEFIYAKTAIAVSPLINFKYKLSDRAYVYYGASIGLVGSRTSGAPRNGNEVATGEKSYIAPDGGLGFCAGLQGGFTRRLSQRLALNAEVGFRYYKLSYKVDDVSYPGGVAFSYSTIGVPVTIGIRYRMGWEKQYNSEGKYRPIPEELEKKGE